MVLAAVDVGLHTSSWRSRRAETGDAFVSFKGASVCRNMGGVCVETGGVSAHQHCGFVSRYSR